MNDGGRAAPGWSSRTPADLIAAQLRAIDAYNEARRATERAAASIAASREMRMDLARRAEARRREHQALLDGAARALAESGRLMPGRARVVIAHRSRWFRDRLTGLMTDAGVDVVAQVDDGALAVGAAVAEQPEMALVEDRLLTLPGAEVVRRICHFAPQTLVGAQVLQSDRTPELLAAGATAVFTRRVPPDELVTRLLRYAGIAVGG